MKLGNMVFVVGLETYL